MLQWFAIRNGRMEGASRAAASIRAELSTPRISASGSTLSVAVCLCRVRNRDRRCISGASTALRAGRALAASARPRIADGSLHRNRWRRGWNRPLATVAAALPHRPSLLTSASARARSILPHRASVANSWRSMASLRGWRHRGLFRNMGADDYRGHRGNMSCRSSFIPTADTPFPFSGVGRLIGGAMKQCFALANARRSGLPKKRGRVGRRRGERRGAASRTVPIWHCETALTLRVQLRLALRPSEGAEIKSKSTRLRTTA